MDKKDTEPKASAGSTAGRALSSPVTRRKLLKGAAGAGIAATAMYVAPKLTSTRAQKAYATGSPTVTPSPTPTPPPIPPSSGTWVMTNPPVPLLDGNGNPVGINVVDLQITGTLGGSHGASGSVSLRAPDGHVYSGPVSGSTDTLVGNSPSDTDSDTLEQVPTEIVAMSLTGNVPVLGPVIIHESPTLHSVGELEETANPISGHMDFPAQSFFDVFVEVDMPAFGQTFHNDATHPLRVQGTVNP